MEKKSNNKKAPQNTTTCTALSLLIYSMCCMPEQNKHLTHKKNSLTQTKYHVYLRIIYGSAHEGTKFKSKYHMEIRDFR